MISVDNSSTIVDPQDHRLDCRHRLPSLHLDQVQTQSAELNAADVIAMKGANVDDWKVLGVLGRETEKMKEYSCGGLAKGVRFEALNLEPGAVHTFGRHRRVIRNNDWLRHHRRLGRSETNLVLQAFLQLVSGSPGG